MARYCPCGNQVLPNRGICQECGEIYGYDRKEWPAWLLFAVNDTTREEMQYSRQDDECLFMDEIEPNGRGGYRPKREFALRGCRTETHLYQDRHKHGG